MMITDWDVWGAAEVLLSNFWKWNGKVDSPTEFASPRAIGTNFKIGLFGLGQEKKIRRGSIWRLRREMETRGACKEWREIPQRDFLTFGASLKCFSPPFWAICLKPLLPTTTNSPPAPLPWFPLANFYHLCLPLSPLLSSRSRLQLAIAKLARVSFQRRKSFASSSASCMKCTARWIFCRD